MFNRQRSQQQQPQQHVPTSYIDASTLPSPRSMAVAQGTIELVAMHNAPETNSYYTYLTFKQGERMVLINESNENWWFVHHIKSGEKGYVPANYVGKIDSLCSEACYHENLSRSEAMKIMENQSNIPIGAFLVRKSSAGKGTLALDVKTGQRRVSHYTIASVNGYFTLSDKSPIFHNLHSFIEHYRNFPDLGFHLTSGIVRAVPRVPHNPSIWEIDRAQFKLGSELGSGHFGTVNKGTWNGNLEVAIKILKNNVDKTEFTNEAEIMKKLDHKNLVRLYGVSTSEQPMYIIMEYLRNGSLFKYIQRKELTLAQNIDIAESIADGMNYLHANGVVHRDLAARNVLLGNMINGTLEVKVADFGLARTLVDSDVYQTRAGGLFPVHWTAPESLITAHFTSKSDVWSFGVLLYELFARSDRLYKDLPRMSNGALGQFLLDSGKRLPRPAECPSSLYDDLMLKCFAGDPDDRPTFTAIMQILKHFDTNDSFAYVPVR